MERMDWCVESVLEIKSNLVFCTQGVSLKEHDIQILRTLIDACNSFLDTVSPSMETGIIYKNGNRWEDLRFDNAMKQFRNVFRREIKTIEDKYKLHFTKSIPEEY